MAENAGKSEGEAREQADGSAGEAPNAGEAAGDSAATGDPAGTVPPAAAGEAAGVAAADPASTASSAAAKRLARADVFKFVGLVAFIAVAGALCFAVWPIIRGIFEPGGAEELIETVQGAGPLGVVILLAIQLLQVIVAFIPGEVVQIAAGMMYGPWLGALVIFVGCVISSAIIFAIVHKLGAPFVQAMVPTAYLDKFRHFEETGKLNVVVFVLFLVPGLPKDVFTYLVPLTDMRLRTFLVLANVARIPGIVVSTYAADGLIDGRIAQSAAIFAVAAVLAVLGIVFRDRIMGAFSKLRARRASKGSHRDDRPTS